MAARPGDSSRTAGVSILLRHLPGSEAAELLTAQVATAADLVGVVRWRTGKTLATLRRADSAAEPAWLVAIVAAGDDLVTGEPSPS
jgi:hypothetical protein